MFSPSGQTTTNVRQPQTSCRSWESRMSPSEPSPKMIRRMTALLLLATFAAGTVTGGALAHWLVIRPSPSSHFPHPMGPVPWDNLDLSASQRDKINEILERHRPKLDAILGETFPKVQVVVAQVDNEIRESQSSTPKQSFATARWTTGELARGMSS